MLIDGDKKVPMVEKITRKNGGLVVCDADEPGDFVSKTLGYDDN